MVEVTRVRVTSGGRRLEVVVAGPDDGLPLVFHGGTPSAAVPFAPLVDAVTARGLRFVSYSRPGYAGSAAHPGRLVADVGADVSAILDHLAAQSFVTVGASGGGPHALGCPAVLPDRCRAAATVAGVAPFSAEGLDWLEGMAAENQEEFGAALQGEQRLTQWLEQAAAELADVTAEQIAAAMGGLLSPVDRASLTGEFAQWCAESFRAAVSTGVAGWRDDDLAFVAPWEFDLAAIRCPVFVWQGDEDRMVPFGHGRWLAEHVPNARARLLPGEGHLSILLGARGRILDELLEAAADPANLRA